MNSTTTDDLYESPIEQLFALNTRKFLSPRVSISEQVEVDTLCGKFRLDFLATAPCGKKTGFECDGKEFHNEDRDEWRDAMILSDSDIDEIYRIAGKDIVYRVEDVFYAISLWSPWLFSERQRYNLERVVPEEIIGASIMPEDTLFSIAYLEKDTQQLQKFTIEKRHKYIPEGRRQFWQAAYQFAVGVGGGKLDDVMDAHLAGLQQHS